MILESLANSWKQWNGWLVTEIISYLINFLQYYYCPFKIMTLILDFYLRGSLTRMLKCQNSPSWHQNISGLCRIFFGLGHRNEISAMVI